VWERGSSLVLKRGAIYGGISDRSGKINNPIPSTLMSSKAVVLKNGERGGDARKGRERRVVYRSSGVHCKKTVTSENMRRAAEIEPNFHLSLGFGRKRARGKKV